MLVLGSVKWNFSFRIDERTPRWTFLLSRENARALRMKRTKSYLLLATKTQGFALFSRSIVARVPSTISSQSSCAVSGKPRSSIFQNSTELTNETALLIPTKSTHALAHPSGKLFFARLLSAHRRSIDQSSAFSVQLSDELTIISFSHPSLFVQVDMVRDERRRKSSKSSPHFSLWHTKSSHCGLCSRYTWHLSNVW
jgi:hypothetical protein